MFTEVVRRPRLLRRALAVADAATAPHGIDRFVEQLAPTFSTAGIRARVVRAERRTPGTVTLTLRPNRNWRGHDAGQHTLVSVEVDGVRRSRAYSLAHSAHRSDGLLELTVKSHPGGVVSGHLVAHARPGLVVGLSPATGGFVLPGRPGARPDTPLLLVSGGSGITPVMSMLRTLCDEGHPGPVTFLHYAPTAADHPYRREVEAMAAAPDVRVVNVYTDAPGTGDLDGFFSAAQLAAAAPRWAEAEAFVCGPAPLMDAVRGHFAAAGRAAAYHDEAFTLDLVAGEPTGGTVTFAGAGVVAVDDGRPLLVQAEAAGLAPEHGCRMGICHTCTRHLTRGTVRHVTTGALTAEAGAEVRLCVSAPVGDVTVDL